MTQREMVNTIYQRLAAAPNGLDCNVSEVLAAARWLISAILAEAFTDPAERAERVNRICWALQACAKRSPATSAQRH